MPYDSHPHQEAPLSSAPYEIGAITLAPQSILGPVLADLPAPGRTRYAPSLARCMSLWAACLRTARLESAGGPILALWLPAEIEAEVERTLSEAPALGLLLHRLAARLVMAALADLRPDLAERSCAPLPEIDPTLARALLLNGLATDDGHLARRYAVLTFDNHGSLSSHQDGCAGCSLRAGCLGPCNRGTS
ncbi:hypothetical protein [Desulfocurvibacter africanus]|uniref:Uncharacterized protein n=1 Tax=Desulfocurvibacter africanus subsp. africanus str. Walvis Bay TaxID=690850 RepID=F3Z1D2_DESAF|nr:hypothetical protein [Desulfocurvibacter africanus]EGJ51135.1 hypothetical protein Desaf_2822 [Desulfocurvibacter africanus subsp. africanus str. Walvis Bay]